MELHGDLNRFNLWVNQFRYLHSLNDYLWFILIILTGCFLINVLIKRLKINFFLGNFINLYHLSYTFFVVKYAETFAHESNSIYSYTKGDIAAPIELKFQINNIIHLINFSVPTLRCVVVVVVVVKFEN